MHGVTTIDRGNANWFGCWAVCPHPSPPAESGLWISPKATRELSRLWRIVRNFSHTDISYLLHLLWLVYMILAKYWSSSLTLNKSWSLTPWEEGTLGYFVMKTIAIPFALLRGANCTAFGLPSYINIRHRLESQEGQVSNMNLVHLFTTFTHTIMHLPKFCITIVSSFSWALQSS